MKRRFYLVRGGIVFEVPKRVYDSGEALTPLQAIAYVTGLRASVNGEVVQACACKSCVARRSHFYHARALRAERHGEPNVGEEESGGQQDFSAWPVPFQT